jgi:hypothetical protein
MRILKKTEKKRISGSPLKNISLEITVEPVRNPGQDGGNICQLNDTGNDLLQAFYLQI